MEWRLATKYDAKELINLYAALAENQTNYSGIDMMSIMHEMAGTTETAKQDRFAFVEKFLTDKRFMIFVVIDDDEIVAFSQLYRSKSRYNMKEADLHIGYLYSKVEHKGYASSLLTMADIVAKESKCKRLVLDVLENNENALKLYLKRGFTVSGRDGIRTSMMKMVGGNK